MRIMRLYVNDLLDIAGGGEGGLKFWNVDGSFRKIFKYRKYENS